MLMLSIPQHETEKDGKEITDISDMRDLLS